MPEAEGRKQQFSLWKRGVRAEILAAVGAPLYIVAMEIQEDGDGGDRDAGQQQKRCGTTEMAFLGKLQETVTN